MKEKFDRHHIFWQRRHYTTPLFKTLRSADGLVVPTWVAAHKLLHIEMGTPPKPTADLATGILKELENHTLSHRFDGLFFTVDFLHNREDEDPIAHRLAGHLTKQLGYLMMRDVPKKFW